MIENNQNTAILIFSRTEKDEAIQKQFLPNNHQSANQKVAKSLIKNTLRTVKKTALPYFIVDSKQQNGKDFGEKFSNALKKIFNEGYDNVITIGNDCPALSANDLLMAKENFNRSNTIGPAKDGGVYLIGIKKGSFDFESFKNLTWQTESLFISLKNYFDSEGQAIIMLDQKADIDSYTDLVNLILSSPRNKFVSEVETILRSLSTPHQEFIHISKQSQGTNRLFSLRAPPIAA